MSTWQPPSATATTPARSTSASYWCKLEASARTPRCPAHSNHGWGKAVDFVDQNGSLTWNSVGYQWLVAHAGEYGWNHPGGVNEAWHWEWVGDGGTMHGYGVRVDLMTGPSLSDSALPEQRSGSGPRGSGPERFHRDRWSELSR